MTRRLGFTQLVFFLASLVLTVPAFAGSVILSSVDALKRLENNQLTLIDIRSPQEWRETGVAKGAIKITIHDPLGPAGFVAKIKALVRGNLNRPIALICAVGIRTTRAEKILKRVGFTNLYHVREGMLGNKVDGPGWLKRGLPINR